MDLPVNQRFYQAIEQLKQQTIHYDYPSDLRSLAAMKRLLNDTKQGTQRQAPKFDKSNTEQAAPKHADTKDIEQALIPTEAAQAKSDEMDGGQL